MRETSQTTLRHFVFGSLLVMLTCLATAATLLGMSFIRKEARRATIGSDQLRQAFDMQLGNMSEEMWTGNLEAIQLRVQHIAEQLGKVAYDAYIVDTKGGCLSPTPCRLPHGEMEGTLAKLEATSSPLLRFDEKAGRYLYCAPLAIGSTLRGFLVAYIADPYDFYRGGLKRIWSETLFPTLGAIILVWLLWLLLSHRLLLKPYLEELSELKRKEAIAEVARHVAHDIRNPLSAVEKLVHTLPELPETTSALLRSATKQIRDTANNLLTVGLSPSTETARPAATPLPKLGDEPVTRILGFVTSQMRIKWKDTPGIELRFEETKDNFALFALCSSPDLKRVLANLLNNAYEALGDWGTIDLTAEQTQEGKIKIKITDNGKGIPPEILTRLGTQELTFQKTQGHGLGLYHAKKATESWGGEFKITSQPSLGTTVELVLPKAPKPAWFVDKIRIPKGATLVLLDDQKLNRDLWKEKLTNCTSEPLSFLHFNNPADLISWWKGSRGKRHFYLCDCDLGKGQKSGLEVIEELGVGCYSLLITHHTGDEGLRETCYAKKVRLLDKNLLKFIDIEFYQVERSP